MKHILKLSIIIILSLAFQSSEAQPLTSTIYDGKVFYQYGVSFRFSYIINTNVKKFKPSFMIGLNIAGAVNHTSQRFRYRPAINAGFNFYTNTIGTERKRINIDKKKKELFRLDYYVSTEFGFGDGKVTSEYTFDKLYNSYSESSIPNDFKYMTSWKTSFIFNNKGFNQRIGNITLKFHRFYLNYINDGGPIIKHLGLGDQYDRYWTGSLVAGYILPNNFYYNEIIRVNPFGIENQNNRIEICYDVHTGFTRDAFLLSSHLLFEDTDYFDPSNVLLNTGSLKLKLVGNPGLNIEVGVYGGKIMGFQDWLHKLLKESKHPYIEKTNFFIGVNYHNTIWSTY